MDDSNVSAVLEIALDEPILELVFQYEQPPQQLVRISACMMTFTRNYGEFEIENSS